MGFFFALVYDPFMRRTERACLAEWRRELLAPLEGDVLEIGAGSGANLAQYPTGLSRLVLSEPDAHMRRRLEDVKVRLGRDDAEVSAASADALPFEAETFDAVVSTLVLCTVPDPDRVLQEVVRVLRPGGVFVFLEHVAAEDDPGRLAWQARLDPAWRHLAEGCRLTRRTHDAIVQVGLVVEEEVRASMRKAPPWVRPTIRGRAKKRAS